MPQKMSPALVDFVYHLAVHRAERKEFYDDPKAYLAKAKAKHLSNAEKTILLKDALEMNRVSRKRREAHEAWMKKALKDIPFVSEFEKVYGKNMPSFTDEDSFIDDDEKSDQGDQKDDGKSKDDDEES